MDKIVQNFKYTWIIVLCIFIYIEHCVRAIQFYPDPEATGDFIQQNETYDFIIVGSSPSGAVLANRLSEISTWKVLLIEAGKEASIITDIPFLCGTLAFTDYNWGYKYEPQKEFCRGCIDQRMILAHGKALGGSTIINYMVHVRGNKGDYDKWAALGNPGWSYKDLFPYFLKSEDARIEVADPGYHHVGGNLAVSDVSFRTDVSRHYVKAAQEAGYAYVDYNGEKQLGVSFVQSTTRFGKRVSAEKAFLRPIRNRKNLKILTKSRAVKILIDPVTKRTYGVKYVRNKKYYTALASKEVILSAGALNSPQLLMLSGIGPKDHLRELGIPVLQNLPVGQKMYDHPTFPGITFQVNDSIVLEQEKILVNPKTYIDYFTYGNSSLSTIGGVEALAFIKTNVSLEPDPLYPDVELALIGGSVSTDRGLVYRRILNVPQETYDVLWKPLENKYVYQVIPLLLHPKSYGYIKLKSKNPFRWPKFYANFFSDPENHDIKTIIASIREIQRINKSPALQKYGSTIITTPIPGCENHVFDSDDYWECNLRTISGSLFHIVATCKMGPLKDPEAVVDANLKVYGIGNLRVADTSIIPLTLSAHTMEPGYMVGEKASDIIKEEWTRK